MNESLCVGLTSADMKLVVLCLCSVISTTFNTYNICVEKG